MRVAHGVTLKSDLSDLSDLSDKKGGVSVSPEGLLFRCLARAKELPQGCSEPEPVNESKERFFIFLRES